MWDFPSDPEAGTPYFNHKGVSHVAQWVKKQSSMQKTVV